MFPLSVNTSFACVVWEKSGRVGVLNWSHPSGLPFFGPTLVHPVNEEFPTRVRRHDNGSIEVVGFVQWKSATRCGVLTKNRNGHWGIAWFTRDEVIMRNRHIVFGGGRVAFDVSTREFEPVGNDFLQEIGLERLSQ
jgi:hypothetical protein